MVVAGGFIRAIVAGEKPSDIDVWTDSKDTSFNGAVTLSAAFGTLPHDSSRAYTVRQTAGIPVQFIYQWTFASVSALIASFDFTIAQAAVWWDGEKWTSGCSSLFYADVEAKRLTYLAPIRNEAIAGSLFRVFKFYKRGYSISLPDLAAVMARATGLDPATIHGTLLEAGSRLPSAPKRCEETPDDMGDPLVVVSGSSRSRRICAGSG